MSKLRNELIYYSIGGALTFIYALAWSALIGFAVCFVASFVGYIAGLFVGFVLGLCGAILMAVGWTSYFDFVDRIMRDGKQS
jgi:hypothetical protein